MDSKHFSLPEQKHYEQANLLAYEIACQRLAEICDIEEQCRKSGTTYQESDSEKTVLVGYLNQSYIITAPDGEISLADGTGEVSIRDKLLIIHYFLTAKGTPATGRLVTFRELPEGVVYSPTFSKRTVVPLTENFGKNPEKLAEVARNFGGYRTDYGDTAVTIDAFSRVPITFVLWRGDDELAPQGNILFDDTVSDYLPTEDITVLCESITWRLVRYLRTA